MIILECQSFGGMDFLWRDCNLSGFIEKKKKVIIEFKELKFWGELCL